jgi:hypothetical protein
MKTYTLDQARFDRLRTKLLTLGITLPDGENGIITYSAVELKYHYADGVLTLAILRKPFIIPARTVWDRVDGWLASTETV